MNIRNTERESVSYNFICNIAISIYQNPCIVDTKLKTLKHNNIQSMT